TDPENEALVQASVAKLIKGKTLIVIAHRLSTITSADQIIVINDGRVEMAGRQEKLLRDSRLYHDMWEAHISAKDSEVA
ncbi:MAG: ABC transporter ATP-binding protein, partial [Eubacterium sp.]|nr:ABC transporter ATP-binding protein [Eubacterium sp.]